jgi:hypothetical protein
MIEPAMASSQVWIDQNSSSGRLNSTLPSQPPSSAPTTPRSSVTNQPPA